MAGNEKSTARELNRMSQTKYRKRMKAMAGELQETLATRRRQLQEAKARRVQSTANNRQLHQRARNATDAVLLCVKQARDYWQAACGAPAAIGSPQSHPRPAAGKPGSPASLLPGGPGAAPAIADVARVRPLRSSDVLPDSTLSACIGDTLTWSEPAAAGSAAAVVMPEDIQVAERMVQDVGVKLAALRASGGARGGEAPGAAVRWMLQSPYTTARGETLSFSMTHGGDACRASRHTFALLLQLETCFLMAVVDPCIAGESPAWPGAVQSSGSGREPPDGAMHSTAAATASAAAHTVKSLLRNVPAGAGTVNLTCGQGDHIPVGTAVPALVRDVCGRYRRSLPQLQWARACWMYADFLRTLKPHCTCWVGAYTSQGDFEDVSVLVHTGGCCVAEGCPRCAVLHALLGALHACFVEAISDPVGVRLQPTPLDEACTRFKELYACMSLMRTHGLAHHFSDAAASYATVLAGQHTITAEAPFMVRSFERLQLRLPQQVLLAAAWRMWGRSRRTQDLRMLTAQQPLSRLARTKDLLSAWQPCPHATPGAPMLPLPEGGPGADALCLCAACTDRLANRLLGVSVAAHGHAARAVRQLQAFQERDAATIGAIVSAVCMPGVFLTAEQIAAQMHVSIEAKVAGADWLNLCRLADEDLRQRDLFSGL